MLHVDLDAFFASVEIRDNPSLAGKPVAVGYGDGQRGVVCAANYEARAFGVRAALSTHVARARCPQLILIEPRHDRYSEASDEVMSLLDVWSPLIEQVSVDEAYLDLAGTQQLHGDAAQVAQGLKRAVRKETGLTISVGGGASKLVAKIASGASKPDGLLIVPAEEQAAWLAPQPVGVIPGIGPVAQSTLRELGVSTCGELAAAPGDHLLRRFGPHGPSLKLLAIGQDDSSVDTGDDRKSLGREVTLDEDVADPHALETLLLDLVESVAHSLRKEGLLARTVTLKLKDTEFVSITRQVKLPQPSALSGALFEAARSLLRAAAQGEPYRLIGVSASDFTSDEQLGLFDGKRTAREQAITAAADELRARFGDGVIRRARLLSREDEP
uniref:DNA polymerase IV n=1 Tax=Candidatus Limnocylindrus sp. TaxID=2802978 RepID=UPI00404B7DE8